MTDELGPEARALLDAARAGLSPHPAAVRRVYARIGEATAGAAATSSLAGKLGVLAIAAVVAVVAVIALRPSAPAAVVPAVVLASPPEAPVRAASHEPPVPAPFDDELIVIEPHEVAPRSSARPLAAPRPVEAPRALTPRAAEPRTADLAREVELVDLAMAALRRGDPRGALAAVRLHRTETADRGQLAEDAAAIEVEALCRLHDPAISARLEAFDARFPRSAQRARLTSLCP